MKYSRYLLTLSLAGLLAGQTQGGVLANLFDDYSGTDFTDATVGTTTFDTNNWTFYQGFSAEQELTYSTTLGTDQGAGFGGDGFEEVALVSADGVFDGNSPDPGELTFHPREGSGAPSDLHIRWTADQDYPDGVSIDFNLRTPTGSNVGLAIALNSSGVVNIVVDWGSEGTTGTIDENNYPAIASIDAGDTLDIIVFNRGIFNGDQTFGNFIINDTTPEGPPEITDFVYQLPPAGNGDGNFSLTWTSVPGERYSIFRSDDLTAPSWTPVQTGIEANESATTSTFDHPVPGAQKLFFRVSRDQTNPQ